MTGQSSILFTLVTCIGVMALVAWVSWVKTRGTTETKDGYFLAGRGLGAAFIAGSLLLTNLSAEQLIGLNGSAYGHNMSSMAWEVTAAVATIAMAFLFLPRYLAGAFTTLPEFLNDRFDPVVRRMSVVLFMLGYGLITIPSVLYSGSIAVMAFFNVPDLTGLAYFPSLALTVVTIGLIGAAYAVLGGLKAVAVSDTLNGVGLLLIGFLVPVLGVIMLGSGDFSDGFNRLVSDHPEKLNAIGSADDPTPFGTIFTGMIFANLFYWCTNQYVIQRTLGARSLAEGQKGVLASGFFKILVPFMMMIPGVIAFHLYGPGLGTIDEAYPRLINDVLPAYLTGFFLAVLLGAVFSSFNSLLNSAATLFTLDIYAPARRGKVSDAQLVRVAKIVSIIIAIFSFAVAPLLYFAEEGLWQVVRVFTGFYNIPTVVIVIIGLFTRRVPALGAKIVIIFHVTAYALYRFVLGDVITLHFIHVYAVLFVIEIGIMLVTGYLRPRAEAYVPPVQHKVDMTPWHFARPMAFTLFSCVVGLYLLFSPLGLASGSGASAILPVLFGLLALANVVAWVMSARGARATG
ncbi:solute:sodium symporter family transporter [Pontixanthobacter aestiaquae]|uniref:Solute:sodium symporter family transporter n=1 Tax=Pontixanthobacter aestiaquae TaxID=1509367 RepID=A0A844Z4X8_9SPHN|nr:solute:sodium symporter family transporter [Pontixanthobacter aestiaquae]MDN3646220.1 solute:sodium symporter family transporter [Pontixanthobacter aestiaquae]MXO82788.1 solute:sodium symporter family transporter [Pontixanthobacter aestiaquae]